MKTNKWNEKSLTFLLNLKKREKKPNCVNFKDFNYFDLILI